MPDTAAMPVLYLSHGAPPLADDPILPGELSQWSAQLPRPTSILVVSAHWEEAPLAVSATETVPLYYDFWGFPQKYYEVTYAAPGAPELAASVSSLLSTPAQSVHTNHDRGLDHGAYVPLVEMYPDADIPVLQLSMPTLDPQTLFEVGRALRPLREEGVLILGSGFTTHNLSAMRQVDGPHGPAPTWSSEFDHWADETMARGDVDSLIDFLHKAPAGNIAHPRTEHFAPLFVSLGAAWDGSGVDAKSVVDGFWFGLSKRSWQLN